MRTRFGVLPLVAASMLACVPGGGRRPPATPPAPNAAPADTAAERAALGGCVRVHHLWKRQLTALDRTAGQPAEARTAALVEGVYRPYAPFWAGYLGDEAAFREWVRTRFTLDGDPRRAVPLADDPGAKIVDATVRMAAFAGRPAPCSDWYAVYGPGWTNLGGLGPTGMVVDFLGMPRERAAEDFRAFLPHEVAHLLIGPGHAGDPDGGTLLARIVEEGFATYAAWKYWAGALTPAQTLGYTDAEWRWALAHEGELWALAAPRLGARDRATTDPFAAASSRPLPGGPGKVGSSWASGSPRGTPPAAGPSRGGTCSRCRTRAPSPRAGTPRPGPARPDA